MKLFNKISLALLAGVFVFSACEKADPLTIYANGVDPVLSASASTVAPPPADSLKVVLTLNWTDPKHSQDTSLYKYVIELDSTGRNFSKAQKIELIGRRTYSFVAKDINAMLLSYGFQFNTAYDVDIRVTSSYGNNNEQKRSNTLKIRMTPYKIPPKVALPTTGRLFIVGGATPGGWNNPVPLPAQELARINETTWGGIFQFSGANEYLLLPVNGSWDTKFAIANKSLPGADVGGDFSFYTSGGDNFVAPAATGLYKVTVDFQQGKYRVEPFNQQHGLPSELFIVGNATPGGWNNPVPVPAQQLTRRNAVQWDITINLTSGGEYLILPTNGDWGRKYGVNDKNLPAARTGGAIKPEGENFPAPTATGNYKFSIDFFTGTYKVEAP
jgi:hypothetical protein